MILIDQMIPVKCRECTTFRADVYTVVIVAGGRNNRILLYMFGLVQKLFSAKAIIPNKEGLDL